jgi:hypothetical protein
MLEVDALPLYYKHHIFVTLMTPNDRPLILSIFLDGDCIPLSSSTRITTAEANGNESTVFPADRFFCTKAPQLYRKMDIQIYNTRNRDVKDGDAYSLL